MRERKEYTFMVLREYLIIFLFWDISKWNRGQTKWDGGSNYMMVLYQISKLSALKFAKATNPGHESTKMTNIY